MNQLKDWNKLQEKFEQLQKEHFDKSISFLEVEAARIVQIEAENVKLKKEAINQSELLELKQKELWDQNVTIHNQYLQIKHLLKLVKSMNTYCKKAVNLIDNKSRKKKAKKNYERSKQLIEKRLKLMGVE